MSFIGFDQPSYNQFQEYEEEEEEEKEEEEEEEEKEEKGEEKTCYTMVLERRRSEDNRVLFMDKNATFLPRPDKILPRPLWDGKFFSQCDFADLPDLDPLWDRPDMNPLDLAPK